MNFGWHLRCCHTGRSWLGRHFATGCRLNAWMQLLHTQSGMQSGMHSINRSREVVTSEREVAHGELDRLERAIDEKGQQLESVKAEYNVAAHQQKEKELELSRAVAAMEKRQELELQIAEAKQRVTKLQQEAKELVSRAARDRG